MNVKEQAILIENTIEEWWIKNKLDSGSIKFTIYIPSNPHFSSYDAWKTANKDDYYKEKEIIKDLDIEEFKQYINGFIPDYIQEDLPDWTEDIAMTDEYYDIIQNAIIRCCEENYQSWKEEYIEECEENYEI